MCCDGNSWDRPVSRGLHTFNQYSTRFQVSWFNGLPRRAFEQSNAPELPEPSELQADLMLSKCVVNNLRDSRHALVLKIYAVTLVSMQQ